jgi:hypothetical protein
VGSRRARAARLLAKPSVARVARVARVGGIFTTGFLLMAAYIAMLRGVVRVFMEISVRG